jgi:hypothetical protein
MSVSNTTKRVKEIRRKTHRKFSSEEKIRIVLEGLRGEGFEPPRVNGKPGADLEYRVVIRHLYCLCPSRLLIPVSQPGFRIPARVTHQSR